MTRSRCIDSLQGKNTNLFPCNGDAKFDKLIVDVGFTTKLNEAKCNVGALSFNANNVLANLFWQTKQLEGLPS
jgi:hypothetical protein